MKVIETKERLRPGKGEGKAGRRVKKRGKRKGREESMNRKKGKD